jgi:hypothetical protein
MGPENAAVIKAKLRRDPARAGDAAALAEPLTPKLPSMLGVAARRRARCEMLSQSGHPPAASWFLVPE